MYTMPCRPAGRCLQLVRPIRGHAGRKVFFNHHVRLSGPRKKKSITDIRYVRSCTGVADHIVFVFNAMQPLPAIELCNLEASEDKFRLSKLSLVKRKDLGWCAETPSPTFASLVGLNICFFLLSRCRCLFGCCCESINCFFLYGHWSRYEEPEGINSSLSFLFRLSGNRGSSSKRYFPAG